MSTNRKSGYWLAKRHDSLRDQAEALRAKAHQLDVKADEYAHQYDQVMAEVQQRVDAHYAAKHG